MTAANSNHRLPELLDIVDLAQHLHVNVRHVRRLVAERRIPFIKWGHLIRFDPDEVREWLERNRCQAEGVTPRAYSRTTSPFTRPR